MPGFIGFAVGRTSFLGPMSDWKDGRITRDGAVSEIARRYREWVDIFESARTAGGRQSQEGFQQKRRNLGRIGDLLYLGQLDVR